MEDDSRQLDLSELAQMVMAHNQALGDMLNEKRVEKAMRRSFGAASDDDKKMLPQALKYLEGKNREHFSGQGFDSDYSDDVFDREFRDLAIRAIDSGANPMAAVMGAARQLGFQPQEAQQIAAEVIQEAVSEQQIAENETETEEMIPEEDGGAIEAARAAQRPDSSGVSVKKGYDDYTNDEIDEMARKNPAKYAALISSK